MRNKIIITSLFVIIFVAMVLPMVNAELGTVKQGQCIDIKTILNSTYVNISSINYPNFSTAITNKEMTKNGMTFNYTFCDTMNLGRYVYDYFDNFGNVYVNDFYSTPTGDKRGISLTLSLFFFGVILLAFGWYNKNVWTVYIGGMLFVIIGIYTMIYGFGDLNEFYTRVLSFVSLGIGFLFTIAAIYEQVWGGETFEED